MTRSFALLALAAACSKSPSKLDQKPAGSSAAATSATGPSDAELVAFCTRSYFTMMDCFKDAEFWQVFSTMYFANTSVAVDEVEREHWIGVMKEDLLKLYNDHEFEKNCRATVANNKAPSERSVKAVTEAAHKSCAAFGSAFGYMLFNEGAFHLPK